MEGIVNSHPFITGIARKHNSSQPFYIGNQPLQFLIAAGNNQKKAEEYYEIQLSQHLEQFEFGYTGQNRLRLRGGSNVGSEIRQADTEPAT